MVDRPYHDYATSALRELIRDLTSSRAQLKDERADYARRADANVDDLGQLEVLIAELDLQLALIDRELVARRSARVRAHNQRMMQVAPKPHCRVKRLPAAVRGRR
jgi:hypothetical protein